MQAPTSGDMFPRQEVPRVGGGTLVLGVPDDTGCDWQMVVVHRGLHCPLCKRYLAGLEAMQDRFRGLGVAPVCVSADPEEKARAFADEVGLTLPAGYALSLPQMRAMGLYVSDPMDAQETDRPFPEPGLFVINAEGRLQVADISNAPFARPDLEGLAHGLEYVRANAYPIRGMRAA